MSYPTADPLGATVDAGVTEHPTAPNAMAARAENKSLRFTDNAPNAVRFDARVSLADDPRRSRATPRASLGRQVAVSVVELPQNGRGNEWARGGGSGS